MPSMWVLRHSDVILQGDFYSGATSRRRPSELTLDNGQLRLTAGIDDWLIDWSSVTVSPRVGNTSRYLYLPDDGVFETADNDGVDALTRQMRTGGLSRWIHRLENHLGLILVAIIVTVMTTLGTFLYGLPWTSGVVADLMPESIVHQVSQTTLETLDSAWMAPSDLSASRQAALQDRFTAYTDAVRNQDVRVVFRSSDSIGANAMALPDGTIIFTDDMVSLAEDDRELVAVLAHEMGHVANNHGMQGVVHSSLTAWLIVMMTGDLSSFADTTVTGPAVLLNLAYSRDMEREADGYGLALLQARGLDPQYFVAIMQRLESGNGGKTASQSNGDESRDEKGDDGDSWLDTVGSLMASHPMTEERIQRYRDAAESH